MRKKDKTHKDLEFEIAFYEKLLEKDPFFIDALIPLAEDYTRIGEFEKGLKTDQTLARLEPNNPVIHYNLACSLSLSGEMETAIHTLERAVELGYRDFSHMERDPDLENLRKTQFYSALKEKIRQKTGQN
ncbi:MAG: hypothetical protein Q8Q33_05450 [Chlamydiota bacterium]|nr:hypothetical protein [Chlamydiota bacterium]